MKLLDYEIQFKTNPIQWLFLTTTIVVVTFLILTALFRMIFVINVEQYEMPYEFSRLTGKTTILDRTGYHFRWPFMQSIYGIDLRPHQVRIEVGMQSEDSANKRVLNAKLVQFNPKGFDKFIEWHGPQDGDVSEILKIYAYDQQGREFPFLLVDNQTSGTPVPLTAQKPWMPGGNSPRQW